VRKSGNSGKPEPEFSGFSFPQLISGIIFGNLKYPKPEIPDPKFLGNPNAQPYLEGLPAPVTPEEQRARENEYAADQQAESSVSRRRAAQPNRASPACPAGVHTVAPVKQRMGEDRDARHTINARRRGYHRDDGDNHDVASLNRGYRPRRAAAAGLGAVAPLGVAACRARTTKTSGSISCARPTSPRSRRGCYCCCAPGCWFCSPGGSHRRVLGLVAVKGTPTTSDK